MEENKFYRVDGVIEIPQTVSLEEFHEKFIDFFEDNGYFFGGNVGVWIDELENTPQVGDIRYCTYEDWEKGWVVIEMQLTKITLRKRESFTFHRSDGIWRNPNDLVFARSSFGKRVFLTKEDAERSLL